MSAAARSAPKMPCTPNGFKPLGNEHLLQFRKIGRRQRLVHLELADRDVVGMGAQEMPCLAKARLELDGERSWVALTEANRFVWPGPDLRPAKTGDPGSVAYGQLPRAFFLELRARFVAVLEAHAAGFVSRSD